MSQMGLAGIIEVVGGALISIGLFTSPVAFIASGEVAVASPGARTARLLAGDQRRRAGGVVLFCLPVFRGGGIRQVEC